MSKIWIELSKATGIGSLTFKNKTYQCGGDPEFDYPDDSTIFGDKHREKYSSEYDCYMYFAVLWDGTSGTYFHLADDLSGSHGCIHLLNDDAQSFYNDVGKGERIRILFKWI